MDVIEETLAHKVYRRISHLIASSEGEFIRPLSSICEVPAPPFKEAARANFVAERFWDMGFRNVAMDEVGNVIAVYPEDARGDFVMVSAHLDTVFPEGTDTRVRRKGDRLYAPGIGDNTAAVAALVYLAGALRREGFTPTLPFAFVANVGEEGLGNLRGMRHIFERGLGAQRKVAMALILDGDLGTVVTEAVGSRRLSVTYRTPGGHSWADFGQPSAIHAAGRAIASLAEMEVLSAPKTTFNVGLIRGGTSVNAIAEDATMLVDLRSLEAGALQDLELTVRRALEDAAAREGAQLEVSVVGDRPTGRLEAGHPLPRLVQGAALALGIEVKNEPMSTDANVPLSMGVPAVVFGIQRGGGAHTLDEFIYPDSLRLGLKLALLSLLAIDAWLEGTGSAAMRSAGESSG